MSVADYMKAFLQHKEKLDEVDRQGTYATSEESYDEEFRKLRELSFTYKIDNVYPSEEAMMTYNVPKNRFKDIVPFDYTRVKLKTVEEGSTSNYINASFIKGAIGDQKYIAAQGPLPKTVNDFWQMIWENDVRVVLMACREYEGTPPKLKCQRYWPNSTTEELLFGNIRVTLEKEEKTSYKEHLIRHMVAKVDNSSRKIVQFHYMEWPDAGVPRSIDGILHLVERLREVQPLNAKETPPVLIHCSAGCGRTGSMIVIDFVRSLIKYGKLTEDFNLYDVIVDLRRQRMAIVQALEQYIFVHEVIAALFKRHLNDISHVYGNIAQNAESGEKKRPPITSRLSKQLSDSEQNAESKVVNAKTCTLPNPTTSKQNIAKRSQSGGARNRPTLLKQVSCEYELEKTQNKKEPMSPPVVYETFGDRNSSGAIANSSGLQTSRGGSVEVVYEDINNLTGGNHIGTPEKKVTTNNAPIIYKGINISYPNRFSTKPRGKRPFRIASGTTRAF